MVLAGDHRKAAVHHAIEGAIVAAPVGQLPVAGGERVGLHREAVVL
jgi:hypothetical protein